MTSKHDSEIANVNILITALKNVDADNVAQIAELQAQANYLLAKFTVKFDVNGGNETIASQTVTRGEKATKPTDPTRDGYVFLGWYVGDEKWSFVGYTVTEDITITAKWQPNRNTAYKVEYYVDDGDGVYALHASEVLFGTTDTVVSAEIKAINGYQFSSGTTSGIIDAGDMLVLRLYYTKQTYHYDGSEVTITFSHTMGANLRAVLDAYIREFNKLYPNITIVHSQDGGYDDLKDKISAEITVGEQPNIAYCYPDHVALYNLSGAVVTLDDLIASEIEITRYDGTIEILGLTDDQIDDFIDGFYEIGRQYGDGEMYSLPFSQSTEVLYYNKTFFDEHNIPVPTTWDELEAVCKRIKEIDPDSIPLGYDSEANWFITMCEQLDSPYTSSEEGNHFLFDNDTNKEFVKRFREWYVKGYVTTQDILNAYTSSIFVGQKSYMSIGSSAGATHQRPGKVDGAYPFEVGIAPVPQIDASNPKAISQGPSLCIFNSENPQEVVASWLFVKFLTTNVDFQAAFSMASGYVPVLESVKDNEVYAAFLAAADGGDQIAALSAKVCLDQKDAYYASPAFNGSSTAREQVGLILKYAFKIPSGSDVDAQIDKIFKDAINECGGNTADTTDLGEAASYLNAMYKDKATNTPNDYDVVAKVVVNGKSYSVTWTTSDERVTVKEKSASFWTIDVPDVTTEEISYTLTATITDANGNTAQKSFNRVVPVVDNGGITNAPEEGVAYKLYMNQATLQQKFYALTSTQNNENKFIETTNDPKQAPDFYVENVEGGVKIYTMVDGVKTYVYAKTTTSADGKISKYIGYSAENSSVFFYVSTTNSWQTTIDGATYVFGTYSTYNTFCISDAVHMTPENTGVSQFPALFMEKEYAENLAPSEAPTIYETAEEIVNAAYALETNAVLSGTHKYTLTGVITAVNSAYSEQYGHVTVTIVVAGMTDKPIDCFRLKGTGADVIAVGDTITVTGVIRNYNGKVEFEANCTLDSYTKGDVKVEIPEANSALTIKEAIKLGNNYVYPDKTQSKYYVTGIITTIDNSTYGQLYISDNEGNNLLVWNSYNADGTIRFGAMELQPKIGDTITVYGVIYKYGEDILMNNAWITAHEAHTCTYSEATCVAVSLCTVCGAVNSPALGHSYTDGACTVCGEAEPTTPVVKYVLKATASDGTAYYWTGAVNNGKGVITDDAAAAAQFIMEEAEGGVYIYFVDNAGVKQYITIGTANIGLGTSAVATVLNYDAETGYVHANDRYISTYKTQDIRTYKASNIPGASNNMYLVMTVVE